jgi:hypothetical protein
MPGMGESRSGRRPRILTCDEFWRGFFARLAGLVLTCRVSGAARAGLGMWVLRDPAAGHAGQ